MNDRNPEPVSRFISALTPSEYGALVEVATRGATGAGAATSAYVEHRLVLLGLALRVADGDDANADDAHTVLILSTAGRTLVNDVHERNRVSPTRKSVARRLCDHDFHAWSSRGRRGLHPTLGPASGSEAAEG